MQKRSYRFFSYASLSIEKISEELQSPPSFGLKDQEALERREKYGPNKISAKETRWWQILIRQLRSPFIYLLLGASVIALSLGEITDAFFIFIFIVINTFLGFYQEFRSDRSLKLLKKYISFNAFVWRDGKKKEIKTEELVPGDIIEIKTGDIVPADARLIEAQGLIMDESALSGESITVNKRNDVLNKEPEDIYQAENLIFSGTTAVGGKGRAIVIATGKQTFVGKITKLTIETAKESGFSKEIGKISSFIFRLVFLTLALVILINILIKGADTKIFELLIFSVALAVAVIPEALPVVSTFSLTRGALRLAKQKVVIRRLSAIEDLGGIEVLCTDKTGTITENKLTVVDFFPASAESSVLEYGYFGSFFSSRGGTLDPFDIALAEAYFKDKKKKSNKNNFEIIKEIPFDPAKRKTYTLIKRENKQELVVRGAVEDVIGFCAEKNKEYLKWVKKQGRSGNRVLAISAKEIKSNDSEGDISLLEKKMTLIGLVAFTDPIKKTTKKAVAQAKKLGVEVKIITGDAPEVAGAVAENIGLINDKKEVITGAEFLKLSQAEQESAVEKYSVFARITPAEKHLIVSLLKKKKKVGFLGEGINDAPAMKASNVSLAVSGASDISRETADIILLQKSLLVIINGIKEGRKVFANTIKYIRATLASNFGNFYAIAVISLFIDFLPILPIQILLVNLLTDFPMISIAADNVSDEDVAKPQTYNIRDIMLIATFLGIVSMVFDFIFFALYFKTSPKILQTNLFIASVFTELIFLFSIRSKKFIFSAERPRAILVYLTLSAMIITAVLPFTDFGKRIFHFVSPKPTHLAVIIGLSIVYLIASETVKLLYCRYFNNNHKKLIRNKKTVNQGRIERR